MSTPRQIDNWSLTRGRPTDPYQPPEAYPLRLQGTVLRSASLPSLGTHNVVTSPIVAVDGRLVTTRSGTVYRLGVVDSGYAKYLGANLDPDHPLKEMER